MSHANVLWLVYIVWLISPELRAQEKAAGPVDQRVLEEIIVTATKREVSLLETAMSVGVLTGQELSDSGDLSILDYWRQVPSLVVADQAFGGNRIIIRGLGEEPNGISESMTAVYFNDTPINQADGLFSQSPDYMLVDVERVEVLRGPQGTLFGASAMGGAVRTVTRSPDPESAGGYLEAGLSSTAHGGIGYGASLVWNQPLGQSTAVRMVAYYEDRAGWVDDVIGDLSDINDQKTGGLRVSLASAITDSLSLTALVQYQDRDLGGFNVSDPLGKPEIGVLTDGDYQVVQLSSQFRDGTASLASLTLNYSAAWADWTSITSWTAYDLFLQIDLSEEFRYNPNSPFYGFYFPITSQTDYQQEAFMQELRVASRPDSGVQWLAGLFYFEQDVPRVDAFYLDDNFVLEQRVDDSRRDYGVFADATWPLTDRWEGTLGIRWYRVEKHNRGFLDEQVSTLDYDEDGFTPRASLAWQPRESMTWYVLASKGFRAGGANTPLAVRDCNAPEAFESDNLWNYETGLKSRWRDNRVEVNFSVYTMDWSDAQVELDFPNCGNVYVANAGEVSSKGLEFELTARMTSSWDVKLVAGYNDAQVEKTVPGSGITAGTPIPLIPDLTAALSSTNWFSLMGRTGFFRADVQYTGSTTTSLYPALNEKQDAYTLVNLRIGLEDESWRVTLFADNLFDELASIVCCRFDGAFSTNRPRTIGVRGSWLFQ